MLHENSNIPENYQEKKPYQHLISLEVKEVYIYSPPHGRIIES
jgi:hypothetical protein